jgi:putative transposase
LKTLIKKPNKLPLKRRCELLKVSRTLHYYRLRPDAYNLELCRLIDEQYLKRPCYGVERMTAQLRRMGHNVNVKRVRRLMRRMGILAIYPKRRTSIGTAAHKKYPYLLRDVTIERPDQVWCSDITYIPMERGFMYLTVVMDWHSRKVLSWELSNTMDEGFCIEALRRALRTGKPEIFNTDQGSQFTSSAFTGALEAAGVKISMDGKGRWMDNVMVERLWRTLKYEYIYLHSFSGGTELRKGIEQWFRHYNAERIHSALDWATPEEVYKDRKYLMTA